MSEMFLMRRADGNFFTEEIDGKRVVPVWSSEEELARYKERNPGLMTFLAAQLTRSMIQKIGIGLEGEGPTGFFLLTEDDPDADLADGRPISPEEIFSWGEHTARPAQQQI